MLCESCTLHVAHTVCVRVCACACYCLCECACMCFDACTHIGVRMYS